MLTRAAPHPSANDLVGPRSALVRKLTEAYWGEVETAVTYVASSTNRDGTRAGWIAQHIRDAIASNLDHAQRLATRIKQLHGPIPGSHDFTPRQLAVRPPAEPDDNAPLLEGVAEAEMAAIARYENIIAVASEAADWVTQDLAVQLVHEKQSHRQALQGYLAELAEAKMRAI